MATESTLTTVPPEITQTIETLKLQVETLQRELSQALEVWQTTLEGDKKQFEELLQHKELAWQEQEERWQRQSRLYEERLEELKTDFEARLKQTEQKGARELGDLEEAWQQEKLSWGPEARQAWPEHRRELETKVQSLEQALSDLENARDLERRHLETRIQELLLLLPESKELTLPSVAEPDLQTRLQVLDGEIAALHDLVREATKVSESVDPDAH